MSTDTASTSDDTAGRERASHRSRWLVVLLVVFAVALVASALWWWRHPGQSFPDGYGIRGEGRVGETRWQSLVAPGADGASEVTIDGLEPVLARDDAAVEVEYLICELDPAALGPDGVGIFGYGLPASDVDRYCSNTRTAVGSTLRLRSEPMEQLLVGVTPTRSGRTTIRKHEMSYGVGWQVGTTDIEVSTTVDAR